MKRAAILNRIDAALERARWRQLKLRGIYLDEADYAAFAKAHTTQYRRRTGSTATLWPLSYEDVLIIGGAALPVKEARSSTVFAISGEGITVPKRLSRKVGRPPAPTLAFISQRMAA